jgi:hypothetical protein
VPDDVLEERLLDLGRRLDVSPAPDPERMAGLVRQRLLADRQLADRPQRLQRLRYAAAAVLIAFAVLIASSAEVRATIVEFFRFAGVIVEQGGPTTPAVAPTAPGEPTAVVDDVAAARAMVAFPVLVPAALGPPDEVTVVEDRVVTFAYRSAGIRMDQFDGELDLAFAKGILNREDVEWIVVDGAPGLWLRGSHEIVYLDRDGQRRTESTRLAASTLVWQRGGVTLRLEGNFSSDEAIAIARSVR